MANEYVTSATLKATLAITGESYADADVALAVEAASRGLDAICNRRFYPDADANQVRYYRPNSCEYVRIDDLATLTSVAADLDGDGTFETALTQNTHFVAGPYNAVADGRPYGWLELQPSSGSYFPTGPRSLRVTGKFGWLAAPPAIVEATSIVAVKLLKRAREAPFAVVSLGIDNAAVRTATRDPEVALLVQPFIRPAVA